MSDSGVKSRYRWADSPELLALPEGQLHLWKLRLNQGEPKLRLLEQTLAPDERARAERFHFERDRRRYIAARGQVRMILCRYLDVDPRSLQFCYGPCGKPFLAQPYESGTLSFSLSHSRELALAVVARDRDVGVDLESIHRLKDAELIAARFFSAKENAVLRALPKAERVEAFFHCWTLKEAYVKATGDGLGRRPTQSFDVDFISGGPACLRSVEGEPEEASRWSLLRLAPERGYVGAVAAEGHDWTLTFWQHPFSSKPDAQSHLQVVGRIPKTGSYDSTG